MIAIAEAAELGVRATTVLRHEAFRSRFLETERNLLVYLPPGYHDAPRRRYPVFYLHDGQNLFDPATAFAGNDWRADLAAEKLIRRRAIEPLILVGIEHGGERRIHELTPTRVAGRGGGQAELYGRMLVEEIVPFINLRYPTLSGPIDTALGGSSLGGLATLYLGLKYPQVFGKLAVMSPAVWWDRRRILRIVQALPAKTPSCIWLDAGTAEGAEELSQVRQLRGMLVRRGWACGHDLRYTEVRGARHEERAWSLRFGRILRYFFPPSFRWPAAKSRG